MVKKNGQAMIIVSGLVLLVALFFVSGVVPFSIYSGQGFSINSISLANPLIKGQTNEWIISTSLSGFGQSIAGNLDNTKITYSGATAQYPLTINGHVSENKAFYLIDNSNPLTLFKYTMTSKSGKLHDWIIYKSIDEPASCEAGTLYEIKAYARTGILGITDSSIASRFCIYKTTVATLAPISSSPNVVPKVHLDISAKGMTQSVDLQGPSAYSFSNGLGSVIWDNNPVQGDALGYLSNGGNYYALASLNTNNWKPVYKTDYSGAGIGTSWIDSANNVDPKLVAYQMGGVNIANIGCQQTSLTQSTIDSTTSCISNELGKIVSIPNNIADKLLNENVKILGVGNYAQLSQQNGKYGFLVDLSNIYASAPHLQLRVKSDWIGIIFPNGIPQVISPKGDSMTFNSGTPLQVNIDVKNIGSGTGNFVLQDFNCGSLKPTYATYPASVEVGGQVTIPISFSTTSSQSETGTCSGKVVDSGSLNSDGWYVYYNMQKPDQCIEGKTYYYGGSLIQICQNGKLVDKETCQYGVVSDNNGNWICGTSNEGGCKQGEIEVIDSSGKKACAPSWDFSKFIFPTLFSMITALLIIIQGRNEKSKGLFIILGITTGILVGSVMFIILENPLIQVLGIVGIIVVGLFVSGIAQVVGPLIKIGSK